MISPNLSASSGESIKVGIPAIAVTGTTRRSTPRLHIGDVIGIFRHRHCYFKGIGVVRIVPLSDEQDQCVPEECRELGSNHLLNDRLV